ncbi:uncharacterized protein GGS22DRAFT_26406 [Annulohypoxylon maeteangense]|uniref:uncharacterized protein n=1 Tax=Annulohypoxylon maeteangense TaxID=1927788 RepID=UPI002007698E|nr:uncharacterized protein GGS22DRAFT_26406 [Annulohypoxylon maeteangense]KAI0883824.1 hypothetical protein GGS22DRAFT_26406 [Annulohypoxylon maeteangense]
MWSFGTTMTMAKDREPSQEKPLPPSQHSQPLQPSQSTENTIQPFQPRPPIFSERSLKQLGLFFGGAGFMFLSTLITRRSVTRKYMATVPKFYNQSNRPAIKAPSDGSLIALEALNLATLNVMGFGIMTTGGLAWAFDVSSVDDLRAMARRSYGIRGGQTDEEAEREIEEWIASVLGRKEEKEKQEAKSSKND